MGNIPTTREGFERLKAELEHLEHVEMTRITIALAAARAEGDLSENAEYHAQRENQGMLQAKINLLKSKIASCYIVDKSAIPKDRVLFGCRVTVMDLEFEEEEIFELVGEGEQDYTLEIKKILCTSPIGQALLEHRVGDRVRFEAPGGIIHYEILAIE